MANASFCVLVLLASAAFAQGSIFDEAITYVQEMAEELSSSLEKVMSSSTDLPQGMETHFKELKAQLVSETKQKVEDAAKKCPEQSTHLQKISESIADRFLECINFTDTITSLEKTLYNITFGMQDVENVVCNGLQNVTLCNDLPFLTKLPCITQAIVNFGQRFKGESSRIYDAIETIEQCGVQIGHHFLKCFTTWSLVADDKIKAAVKANCKN